MSSIYNPASLRVRELTSGLDVPGVVTVIFPDGTVTDIGRGRVEVATGSVAPIYAESTTDTDGVETSFPFLVPIGTLVTGFVGGQAQSPADCSVVAGALVLAFAPGDAENVGFIKVGALYLP